MYSTALTQKQIMLEVTRLYQDYVLVSLEKDQLNNELLIARKKHRTLQFDLFKLQENTSAFEENKKAIKSLENRLQILEAQHTLTKNKITSFCNIDHNVHITLPKFESIEFSPKTISEFLLLSISQSEGVVASEILSEIEKQKTQMVRTKRWLDFNFTAALGDLLTNPASIIYSSLSWTYNIIDMGNHDREVIRAQAAHILQAIETENQKKEVIKIAGQTWINLIESAALYEEQLQNIRNVKKEIMIFEEKSSNGIFQSEDYSLTNQKLFNEKMKLKIFHMNYVTAIIQYSLLSGESASLWLG